MLQMLIDKNVHLFVFAIIKKSYVLQRELSSRISIISKYLE